MLSPDEKEKIRVAIERKARDLDERIEEYRELTKPIPPSEAIGRVSRMDAINNKSVNEAALRQAEKQRQGLDRALQRLDDDRFGGGGIFGIIFVFSCTYNEAGMKFSTCNLQRCIIHKFIRPQ